MATLFHLALPCVSISKTRQFYNDVLGADIGRSAVKWADINLFGHQMTFTECGPFKFDSNSYNFNGDILPSFHFGVILKKEDWNTVLERLKSKNVSIVSQVKFLENKTGEHQSFFVKDPNDFTVEFKCFDELSDIFNV
ncbi:VOC family protein [Gelidibacter maritimus]|uniref:VOC family protein n=1 Tax=Gelidibacter maritimus TaxID=2761487 RepID=A0A7W2M6A6_9FLAO|nr:VOC family protein [Gelidibacter maritimus]MBA6153517.1 VOC family protein [Gelidibacter maritimus]